MFTINKNQPIDKEVIKRAIKENEKDKVKWENKRAYYEGIHPILYRTKTGALKNNTVVVNHPRYITDINVGYLVGNPVEYQHEEGNEKIDAVLEMYKKHSIDETDTIIAQNLSVMGTVCEYVYPDKENELKTVVVNPDNCIMIYDNSVEHLKVGAIMYSGYESNLISGKEKFLEVKLFTETDEIEYNEELEVISVREHYFGKVPVVKYINNINEFGDFEPAIKLIDAYNTLMSDRVNDKEQLVEALLIFYGVDLTPDILEALKVNRVMTTNKDSRAEYLVKQLNEADTDILRQVIEADIFKTCMTPNFTDENFAGNSSGVALAYKLLPFEQNVKTKERYMKKGLLERMELYSNYLNKLNKNNSVIEKHKVMAIFKKALPHNDLEMSQIITNLDGKVSNETLIGQISFVEDADEETKLVKEQKKEAMALENEQFGTEEETIANEKVEGKKKLDNQKQTIFDKIKNIAK